ncbi:MAG: ECF transporter S component [Promethearchaeota archaeon]
MEKRGVLANPTGRLALLAVLTALTTVLTMLISIPVAATQGYINLGDAGVFLAGLLLGPIGGIAGGAGSALADWALGYITWVPITFVVKGLEGTVTGIVFYALQPYWRTVPRLLLALILGSFVMVAGYLFVESLMYGVAAAAVEIPGNIFQVAFGSIMSTIVYFAIDRMLQPYQVKPQTPKEN